MGLIKNSLCKFPDWGQRVEENESKNFHYQFLIKQTISREVKEEKSDEIMILPSLGTIVKRLVLFIEFNIVFWFGLVPQLRQKKKFCSVNWIKNLLQTKQTVHDSPAQRWRNVSLFHPSTTPIAINFSSNNFSIFSSLKSHQMLSNLFLAKFVGTTLLPRALSFRESGIFRYLGVVMFPF